LKSGRDKPRAVERTKYPRRLLADLFLFILNIGYEVAGYIESPEPGAPGARDRLGRGVTRTLSMPQAMAGLMARARPAVQQFAFRKR
jgi:hypothetical protein